MKEYILVFKKALLILFIASSCFISYLTLPSAAHAAVSGATNTFPAQGLSGVTYLCGPTGGYSCTPGYIGTNATGWAWTYYGCPNFASGCPNTPHNCVLYAAFRLMEQGVTLDWNDNAYAWATRASAKGVPVDQTPAIGSIAQWNSVPGDTLGHVAYVESTDASGITITMDDYSTQSIGYVARVHINYNSPSYPDNFIHFSSKGTFAGTIVEWNGDTKTQRTAWFVSTNLARYWIPDSSTYNCLKSQGFPDVGAQSSSTLDQLPDQSGQWATCNGDTLSTNRLLFRGTYLRSQNGQYSLVLQQNDGNLVMYGPNGAVWANSQSSDFLVTQTDNNLVTYGFGVGATWATGTGNTGANALVVQNDGNLVLYASGGVPIWDRYHGRLR